MRFWLLRIGIGIGTLAVTLIVVVLVGSLLVNLATSGESKPVQQLWHGPFVEADGVLTAYRVWGSGNGTPVLLIGGFAEPTFVWDELATVLARDGHRVYALDLDGFGYTERRGPWTLAEWGDQVKGFMNAIGIKSPLVVGHSLGAAVAVELVRRGLADRIVLVDGDARGGGGPPGFVREVVSHTPLIKSALRIARHWDWPVHVILSNAYGPGHPVLDHALIEKWTEQFRANGAEHAIDQMVENGIPGFSRAQLRNIRVRATVVWGSKDSVDSRESGRQTAADLHARFVLVPGAGHISMVVFPTRVAQAIEAQLPS